MAHLAVSVIGEFVVIKHGKELAGSALGSRKARTLLALLAVRGGPVSMDTIVEALWGESPPRDPEANIATLASRLRATLDPALIEYCDPVGYRLNDHIRVDLLDAPALVAEAESRVVHTPAQALAKATDAIQLLDNGQVLPEETSAVWADSARRQHGDLLRRARHAVGESALRVGDLRSARVAAEAAASADPYDEAACRTLMRVYHAAGEPARALLAYERLRTTLSTELSVDPAAATRDLHVAILRDTAGQMAS